MTEHEQQPEPAAEQHGPAFYAALARAIRVLRAERGLERRELAGRAGISYPYLSEIEAGKKRASSQTVLAIAQALGVRPHELVALAESLALDRGTPDQLETTSAAGAYDAPPPRTQAPRPASRFFHAPPAPAAPPEEPRATARPAFRRSQTPPRTLSIVMRELQGYLERMAPEDVERVLDLARRLSR